jgi:hypothetical protein
MNESAEVAKQQLDGDYAGCPVCEAAVRAGDFVVQEPTPDYEVGGRVVLVQAGLEALHALGQRLPAGGEPQLSDRSSFAA